MKRFFKVFLVALLSLTTAATLLACDKEEQSDSSTPDVSKIVLVDKTVEEDGYDHSIMIQGTLPEGVTVTYIGNNQKAVGKYMVKAFLHYNGKVIKELSATLTITAANLPDVTTPEPTPEVTTPEPTPEVTTPEETTPEPTPEVTTPEETTPEPTPEVTTPEITPDPEALALVVINGVSYPMAVDSGASLPGLEAAFMALGLEVSEGDEIAFIYNGVELTTGIGPDPDDTANNIPNNVKSDENWSDVTFNIINGGVVNVYFKVWADGHSFWVTGGQGGSTPEVTTPEVTTPEITPDPEALALVVINGVSYPMAVDSGASLPGLEAAFMALGLEVSEGDEIAFIYNGVELTTGIGPDPDDTANNIPNNVKSDENWSDVTFNIINGGVVNVYFKVWADGHSFWVTGGQGGSTPDITTPEVTTPEVNPGDVPTTGYHLVINGTVYVALTKNDSAMDPSFTEYYALGVEFAVGDIVTLYNADQGESWVIQTPDSYSSGVWTGSASGIECGEAGVYNVYVKMKYQADQIYFGK